MTRIPPTTNGDQDPARLHPCPYRLPRNAVVWSKTVTRSSSSSAGVPVKSRAGRTLAVIPKSTTQTSPRLTTGILVLHAIEEHRSFKSGLIAEPHVLVLSRQLQEFLADSPTLGLGQLRQFVDDFRCAHARTLPLAPPKVNAMTQRFKALGGGLYRYQSGSLYFASRSDGKLHWTRLKSSTCSTARKEISERLHKGESKTKTHLTLTQLLDLHRQNPMGLSPSTLKVRHYLLDRFLESFPDPQSRGSDITPLQLRLWLSPFHGPRSAMV